MSDTRDTDNNLLESDCTWGCNHRFSLIRERQYDENGKCLACGPDVAFGNEGLVVLAEFTRKLERERDELREENAQLRAALAIANPEKP